MEELSILQIKNALIDNYNAYAQGLDSKDWGMVRGCFADKVYFDYGIVSEATGGPDVAISSDDWMLVLQSVINGFDITRHTITNHRFQIDDEVVRCQAYLMADHVIFSNPESTHLGDQEVMTVVGEYTNEYHKTEAGWKICRSKLVMNYTTGNMGLMAIAGERVAAQADA
jgi:hypothetical protein